ncbi:MAG: NAD-dependent epimerase/dehydratase family protein, partial [Flavobacteriales bacterium]|nr:NAD-dependent epimerase/dehydratase family protein [Flavobacteriales bacterium]
MAPPPAQASHTPCTPPNGLRPLRPRQYLCPMIVVTGAAGFIASRLLHELQQQGYADLVAVDDFSRADKARNLDGIRLSARVER